VPTTLERIALALVPREHEGDCQNAMYPAHPCHCGASNFNLLVADAKKALEELQSELHGKCPDCVEDARIAVAEAQNECPDCGGNLGGGHLGRLETHKAGCPRFPL